jgi:hypothetical protein
MEGMKYCKGCDTTKPWTEFTIRKDTGKPVPLCKSCRAAKQRSEHVTNVTEHTEHVTEQYAEIRAELHAIRAENAELRRMIEALSNGTPRPAADVNININAPQPDTEDPRYTRMANKLLALNFAAEFENADKKGH